MSYNAISKNEMLSILRRNRKKLFLDKPVWCRTLQLLKLEEQLGNVLYLPLDLEPLLDDTEEQLFKEWFFEVSKPIKKYNPNVGLQWGDKDPYDAVTTPDLSDNVYQQNPIEIDKFFPGIKKKLKQLPFKEVPEYRIWSSKTEIPIHRDAWYPLDVPSSFRFMLFDENPESTFWLQEDFRDGSNERFFIPKHKCFSWNNLRTTHGSVFSPQYRKALLIPAPVEFDLRQFRKLIMRSVKKYENEIVYSSKKITDFIDV